MKNNNLKIGIMAGVAGLLIVTGTVVACTNFYGNRIEAKDNSRFHPALSSYVKENNETYNFKYAETSEENYEEETEYKFENLKYVEPVKKEKVKTKESDKQKSKTYSTFKEKKESNNASVTVTEKETPKNFSDKDALSKNMEKDINEVYYEYIDSNARFFDSGMLMCDLNEDGIPEIFSLTSSENDLTSLIFHEFKEGKVKKLSDTVPVSHVDLGILIKEKTFYFNPLHFAGVYRNKITNKKAIIISSLFNDGKDVFDIITYDGNSLQIENKYDSVLKFEKGVAIYNKIDEIMINYELCDDKLYSKVQLQGLVDAGSVKATYDELLKEFKSGKGTEFGEIINGEVECYIRNINVKDNEIELVPVEKISYEEYKNAVDNNGTYKINGESASIENVNLYDGNVYMMPHYSYYFEIPQNPGEESVIESYFGNKPFKVKMSEDFKIIYENFLSENCLEEYSIEEYLPMYAARKMNNYTVAQIDNGVISSLKILYHP